jgi:hypothetical protein
MLFCPKKIGTGFNINNLLSVDGWLAGLMDGCKDGWLD